MMTTNFEWDKDKAKINLRKHDISFNEAKTVFEDTYSLTLDDPTHSILEDRFLTIGYSSQNRLLLVVHAERQENIRIISARRVTKHEKKSMNKVMNDTLKDDEMLDDYSEVLTESHLKSAVRGKYARSLADKDAYTVKIIAENEERCVNMKTIEVEAFVNNEGQLTVQVPSNLKEGQYHAVLIIEEPKNEN